MNVMPELISLIEVIKKDRTHGASQLARQAAEVISYMQKHLVEDS